MRPHEAGLLRQERAVSEQRKQEGDNNDRISCVGEGLHEDAMRGGRLRRRAQLSWYVLASSCRNKPRRSIGVRAGQAERRKG